MKVRSVFVAGALASAVVFVVAGNARASTIAFVESQPSGTTGLTIDQNPVVTAILSVPGKVNGETYTNYSFLANDGTGSLDVFGKIPASNTYTPTVGDAITATGEYDPFDQIPELETLTAISKVSSGNPVPAPAVITIPEASNNPQPLTVGGYLFTLNDVTISDTGTGDTVLTAGQTFAIKNLTLTVTDSSSNSMSLFYWPTSYSMANTNLFGTVIPSGPVNIVGFADGFSSGPEFVPISITAVPEPASLSLLALGGVALLNRRRR